MDIVIRQEEPSDYFETESMVRRSFFNKFTPGCNEHLLVHEMRGSLDYLHCFSRVAVVSGKIVGVIMYFAAKIVSGRGETEVVSFGPLAVDHAYKNKGIGTRLLDETIPLVREAGYPGIVIFGEPDYYPKHGFVRAGSLGLRTADGKVFDSFLAYELYPGALEIEGGRFIEPEWIENLPETVPEDIEAKFEPFAKAVRPCQWSYDNATDEKDGYHLEYAVKNPRMFRRMFLDYVDELATFDPSLAGCSRDELLEDITTNVWKTPYVVCMGDTPVGILVTSVPGPDDEEDGCNAYFEEVYIKPEYRGRHIAKDIFVRYLKAQKGSMGFCVIKENSRAIALWEGLLTENGYSFNRFSADQTMWFYKTV